MKKTFEEWERAKGLMAYNLSKFKTSKLLDEGEFNAIVEGNFSEFHGVDYKKRLAFLEKNGYEVTRENLINPELSSKPVEE